MQTLTLISNFLFKQHKKTPRSYKKSLNQIIFYRLKDLLTSEKKKKSSICIENSSNGGSFSAQNVMSTK